MHHIQVYHIFPTFFIDFMLAQFGVTSTKLQTIQQTCPNMLRFRALMSTKLHCAQRLARPMSGHIFGACAPLGQTCGHALRQGRPIMPGHAHMGTFWAPNPPHGCHPDPTSACLRQHPNLQFVISTVGGSAMHMERPDDVGREAGIGRTRNRKGLTIFRACPC